MWITGMKLQIPQIPENIVLRPQLLTKFDEGLNHKLTLITAPPGYGKTTMMSQWISRGKIQAAWLTLDQGDNDWIRFWSHFSKAIQNTINTFNNEGIEGVIKSKKKLLPKLLNHFSKLEEPLIIVLDDFHNITDDLILHGISSLFVYLPDNVYMYIISQYQPTLRLARFRADGELNELNVNDFRFSIYETKCFCENNFSYSLSEKDLSELLKQTEGWITGIKLFILIIQDNDWQLDYLSKISGSERQISNYFLEEVFEQQTKEKQECLVKMSIFSFFNEAVCADMTTLEVKDQLFQEIDKGELFIVPLEERERGYRYHTLFQKFLLVQLKETMSTEQIRKLHLEAGKSLVANHFYKEAIQQFICGEDFELALDQIEEIFPKLVENESKFMWEWMNQIPKDLLFKRPRLYLISLISLIFEGNMQKADQQYTLAKSYLLEKKLPEKEERIFRSTLLYFAVIQGYAKRDLEGVLTYSSKYLEENPEGELLIGYRVEPSGYSSVSEVYISSNSLFAAEKYLKYLLDIWSPTKNYCFYAHLCIDYGKLLYEWNRVSEAEDYIFEAIKMGKRLGNIGLECIATLLFIEIQYAENRSEKADYLLESLQNIVNQSGYLNLSYKVEFFILQQKWKQGKIVLQSDHPLIVLLQSEEAYSKTKVDASILRAHLLVAENNLEVAIDLLKNLLWLCRIEDQQGDVIRVLLCKSLFLAKEGQIIQSYYQLEEALELSQKDNYLRSYLDFGSPMVKLLSKYLEVRKDKALSQNKKISIEYVKSIASFFPIESQIKVKGNTSILTKRELDVLSFMQRGKSNKDIAFHLDIAIATVKTHNNNIYRKLQVNNRLQAIHRANKLGILNAQLEEEEW